MRAEAEAVGGERTAWSSFLTAERLQARGISWRGSGPATDLESERSSAELLVNFRNGKTYCCSDFPTLVGL